MNSLRRIGARFLLNRHSKLRFPSILCHRFSDSSREEDAISRDWLNQLWLEERKKMNVQRGRKQRNVLSDRIHDNGFATSHFNEQPTICRHVGEFLSPTSPEEVKLAPLLARSNLLITRDVEWANIMLAIEQESRYAIMDPCFPQSPVGFIHEKSNLILRQLLRSRRPFTAQIIDAMGNEIFRIRRPIWFINSTIYADVDGKEIGVVHRRWHLWKRIYDLYLGNNQFAVVENPGFWNWTFTLKDENDNVLAQIDRDWRGIGFELFTDAGQYVIRFGDTGSGPKSGLASVIEQLEVARPLTLAERAVAVALAVSLDSDYFSRRGGWALPFLIATE